MVKNLLANAGELGSIPGLGRSLGGGNGNPLQYSCLENPMDRGAWWAAAHGSQRVGHNLANKQQRALGRGDRDHLCAKCSILVDLRSLSVTTFGYQVKNLPANAGDSGLIPGSGRSLGKGNGNPLQYSCLENLMDRSLAGYSPPGHKELDTTE